ncbi:hemerythrin domain-containing protein [Sphingomonas arenae]|uniref:hemerythrin domain-containing protein n=1 Tax=Sphingomonas arenae TaxID=2812555 RepID=UPI0019679EAC|nr:hemerythrin domain-containing protein [Sphingomonas arenae]
MSDKTAPDAVTLLKEDHRRVEELFKEFQKAKGDGAKKRIAEKICAELIVHTELEEKIFYPACEGKVKEDDLQEAYVEHDSAKVLVAEIANGGPDDDFYEAKVKVLQEEIEHHVKEEEGWLNGIFSQARRHGVDMDALGLELAERQKQLFAQIKEKGLPKVKLSTMETARV